MVRGEMSNGRSVGTYPKTCSASLGGRARTCRRHAALSPGRRSCPGAQPERGHRLERCTRGGLPGGDLRALAAVLSSCLRCSGPPGYRDAPGALPAVSLPCLRRRRSSSATVPAISVGMLAVTSSLVVMLFPLVAACLRGVLDATSGQ